MADARTMVYVVTETCLDDYYIVGVFLDKASAKKCRDRRRKAFKPKVAGADMNEWADIEEWKDGQTAP